MPQFHETGYGRKFFTSQLPELIRSINNLSDSLSAVTTNQKTKPNQIPYFNKDELLKEVTKGDGYITGIVAMSVFEMVGVDIDYFNDVVSMKLTGSPLLMDITYEIIGHEGDDVIFNVTGDASDMVEHNF